MKALFERIKGPMDPEFAGVRFPEPDPLSPSELYHENSKLHPSTGIALGMRIEMFLSHKALQQAASHPYKAYPTYPHVPLLPPTEVNTTLSCALHDRRCVRTYCRNEKTSLQVLSNWLGLSCGLVARPGEHDSLARTYPSGGGLYPLEVYVAVRRVQGLANGLYHYNVAGHCLEQLADHQIVEDIASNLTQQDAASSAHVVVIITAVFMRTQYKYGERGYRFVLLEAGHLMQNLCLLAPALGLGTVPLGGYYDDRLHDLLGVDGVDEAVVYVAPAGLLES